MQGRKTRVRCVETGVVYDSLTAAAKAYLCDRHLIWKALNGYTKTCMGCHWEYA